MKSDLTQGNIFATLLRLALPIAASQAMQMAYNLTDMFWLGRVSSEALAATGAAGLFTWLAVGLMMVGRIGAEVGVSQARGRGDIVAAYDYSRNALYISAVLGVAFAVFLFVFRVPLVGFFRFEEASVAADAALYTGITAFGLPAVYITSAITGSFVASGNSRTPFLVTSGGLILNMLLTPIMIFPLGMGVFGAAVSSVASQTVVLVISLYAIKRFRYRPFAEYRFFEGVKPLTKTTKEIFSLALPVSLENTLWPLLTIVTTRIEASFGAIAVSISRVGIQVESLSWLVGAGFGAALTAFVGQNFGAGEFLRIKKGVQYAAFSLIAWGAFVTLFMWFGAGAVYNLFFPHYRDYAEVRSLFITHMRILAVCQIFANMEYVAANAFRGKGRTIPPSIASISSNMIRVPLAFFLSLTPLGVLGVWAAISFTAGLRGVVVSVWYIFEFSTRQKS
ncbi:MAG: MATE family efflux transporter [Defluviitaleaceae bacterium]|nr:MATE family efflux transporter [Defluviitaleaceae bacterium]